MDIRTNRTASLLLRDIYGSSGILFAGLAHPRWLLWTEMTLATRLFLTGPLFTLYRKSREVLRFFCCRCRGLIYTDERCRRDLLRDSGALLWDFRAPNGEETARECRLAPLQDVYAVAGAAVAVESTDALMVYVKVPRDIIIVYTDLDVNVIRKVKVQFLGRLID